MLFLVLSWHPLIRHQWNRGWLLGCWLHSAQHFRFFSLFFFLRRLSIIPVNEKQGLLRILSIFFSLSLPWLTVGLGNQHAELFQITHSCKWGPADISSCNSVPILHFHCVAFLSCSLQNFNIVYATLRAFTRNGKAKKNWTISVDSEQDVFLRTWSERSWMHASSLTPSYSSSASSSFR